MTGPDLGHLRKGCDADLLLMADHVRAWPAHRPDPSASLKAIFVDGQVLKGQTSGDEAAWETVIE